MSTDNQLLRKILRNLGGTVGADMTDNALLRDIDRLLSGDGLVLNGVAHFVRSTRPLVRVDGSALVIGDRYYNTTKKRDFFFDGTQWLSVEVKHNSLITTAALSLTGVSVFSGYPVRLGKDYLEKIEIYYRRTAGTLDASNNYVLSFFMSRNDGVANGAVSGAGTFEIAADGTPSGLQGTVIVNSPIVMASNHPMTGFITTATVTGSPGTVRYYPLFFVREIDND